MQRIYWSNLQDPNSWNVSIGAIKFPFNIEKAIRWIQKHLHILKWIG